jgi:predicted nucleic acid-binding protein
VILPSSVKDELSDPNTPLPVRDWIADPPVWVEVRQTANPLADPSMAGLGPGETAAIALAVEIHADLLLMDDRRGVTAALQRGLSVTGTMGLLASAAKHGIVDLADAFDRLKRTNFRYRQETMDELLAEHKAPLKPDHGTR